VRMNATLRALGLTGLLALTGPAQADVAVTFNGTLIEPPPCLIDNGRQIDVNFGDRVGINKVDGVNYLQAMNYQITCSNPGSGFALTLSLTGTATAFDNQALATDKTDLGIRIYQNNIPFTPNTVLDIDLNNPPPLTAVPVKRAGATLTEGAFEAWATLHAEYQ
jgi:type 1 fimbria pilin